MNEFTLSETDHKKIQDLLSALETSKVGVSRDPIKERQLRSKMTSTIMMAYAVTSFGKDPGVPAAMMELQAIANENFARIVDAYWAAKE